MVEPRLLQVLQNLFAGMLTDSELKIYLKVSAAVGQRCLSVVAPATAGGLGLARGWIGAGEKIITSLLQ